MKISSISSVKAEKNCQKNNQTSFKGVTEGLVKFWQVVDNGGRALQFTVEDMCGTNIPRTYKGAMAGYKYTGKINIPALLQEAVREFLTGPTMCITPFVVLSLGKKKFGKNVNTHIENLKNLSYLALNTKSQNGAKAVSKDDFFKTVAYDVIEKTTGVSALEEDVEALTQGIKQYDEAMLLTSEKGLSRQARKSAKQKANNVLSNLQATFEGIIKRKKDSYQGVDFLSAKYSIAKEEIGSCNFKNYMGYTTSYAQDLFKGESKELNNEIIENFKKSCISKRGAIIAGMIFITGLLMSYIPKLYTMVSGSVNPNATAIYDEAKGINNKEKKEAK